MESKKIKTNTLPSLPLPVPKVGPKPPAKKLISPFDKKFGENKTLIFLLTDPDVPFQVTISNPLVLELYVFALLHSFSEMDYTSFMYLFL